MENGEGRARVIGLMLMGGREEPYLPAVLHSLDGAVDNLVVNDNGAIERSANRIVLESSALAREGRVEIVEAPFVNFSAARNLCLAALREQVLAPGEDAWLITTDCDEVHGANLAVLTRRILPALPPTIGVVDGYFVQFMHAFDWFLSVDRRHNLLFRHNPDVAWERNVHEHIGGLAGRRICLPYVYYHYGYVTPAVRILAKWTQYNQLGDPTYSPAELGAMQSDELFSAELPRVMPFTWGHPPALGVIESLDGLPDTAVERFRRRAQAHFRRPAPRVRAALRKANYRLRRVWRAMQVMPVVPPHLWRDLMALAF